MYIMSHVLCVFWTSVSKVCALYISLQAVSMKIRVSYRFANITENLQSDLKKLIQYNIDHKLDTYLKSYHPDAECDIDVSLDKIRQSLYIWSLNVKLDGQWYYFDIDQDTPFKNPEDLISHLFTHLKEKMSKEHHKWS